MDEHEAILRATIETLRDRSFGALTMDEVATRAGLEPAVIYRLYRSRSELVIELLRRHAEEPAAPPDSGDFRSDLVAVIHRLIGTLHPVRVLAAGVMGEAVRDPELGREWQLFLSAWQRPARMLVERSIARELCVRIDPREASQLLCGILVFRIVVLGEPAVGLAERLAEPILRAWGYFERQAGSRSGALGAPGAR